MASNDLINAILGALVYSDIFDSALTEEELFRNLISRKRILKKEFLVELSSLSKLMTKSNGFFCLKDKEEVIISRKKRIAISVDKITLAKKIIRRIACIPSVYFIGLTGSLGHLDSKINDDIDLMIISKKNTAWTTRLLAIMILELFGKRRRRGQKYAKDMVCLNLIFDESAMLWPAKKRNLYTAHEIVNIYPIYDKNNAWEKFIATNRWVRKFYANGFEGVRSTDQNNTKNSCFGIKILAFVLVNTLFEPLIRKIQWRYMKKKVTNEKIEANFMAFHPFDYRHHVLSSFGKKMKKYRSLTKKL